MFRSLTELPTHYRKATLLSDRPPIRLRIVECDDRLDPTGESKEYEVIYPEELEPGILEACTFRQDATDYVLLTSTDGKHHCTCPAFEHDHRDRPCKHLAAAFTVGILRRDLVPYLKGLNHEQRNENRERQTGADRDANRPAGRQRHGTAKASADAA